jgi:hypothetical protein
MLTVSLSLPPASDVVIVARIEAELVRNLVPISARSALVRVSSSLAKRGKARRGFQFRVITAVS